MSNSNHDKRFERQTLALRMTAIFGHLRPRDLTLYTVDYSDKSVQQWLRTFAQLEHHGLVQKRGNALGTTSYVLTHLGARVLRESGQYEDARASTYLTPTGATFFHRTLSNMGMLWILGALSRAGVEATSFSEYEMQRCLAPVKVNGALTAPPREDTTLPHAPDGLILTDSTRHHWLEAEASYRTKKKVQDKLAWLGRGFNNRDAFLKSTEHELAFGLESVIFIVPVGPDWYDHEKRLRTEILKLPRGPNGQIWSFLRLHVDRRLRAGEPEFVSLIRKPKFVLNLITDKPMNESSVSLYPIMQNVLRKP